MKNIYPDLFIFTKKHFKFTKKPKFQHFLGKTAEISGLTEIDSPISEALERIADGEVVAEALAEGGHVVVAALARVVRRVEAAAEPLQSP